ncbi:NAD(P)-binding protein [Pluteus cervinus]|uniref:NAD(P)-binding protein n=1 Tax=Pluteus cervinus TaxID=181527 RepID=A0ACD3B5M9_9AGAR|nr:NAD(P)-binding protein [Pluteus cervinus]
MELKTTISLILFAIFARNTYERLKQRRTKKVPVTSERVLILGASTGVGRVLATLYAKRGARVCVVGRREGIIREVVQECLHTSSPSSSESTKKILGIAGDFADAEAMIGLRDTLKTEWQGVDTVIVAAGVSALQPLLTVAGLENNQGTLEPGQISQEGLQHTIDVAMAATRGNYLGPLVSAVTFIPLLTETSKSPAILLVSSVAAVIPPPTRTLYGSTKAASLVLYQALSVEHPDIAFTHFLPATIEGDFRASAVDNGPVREADPNKHGLRREVVAGRCIEAIDRGEKMVFMPKYMRYGHLLYWIWPAFVEWRARVKYNFLRK